MSTEEPVRIGLIGCGYISALYLHNLRTMAGLRVVACADLDVDRARARAAEFGIARVLGVDALLEDDEIEAVLDLTVPIAHGEINRWALQAGKHVYSEKPLASTRAEGYTLLEEAGRRGLLLGCAPDTFLGPAWQACRRALDGGVIGEPVAGAAFMMIPGHESWHPDPAFYYAPVGGPLFDMGPYYLTALVSLLGPVRRVTGSARITFPQRTITSQPRRGEVIDVTTPTHLAAVLDFAGGAVVTLVTSFDVWSHTHGPIELYGTEGTLLAPDPNHFTGAARARRGRDGDWEEVYPESGAGGDLRGIGLAGLAAELRGTGRLRASGALAYHVLEVMQGVLEASETGRHVAIASSPARPEPL